MEMLGLPEKRRAGPLLHRGQCVARRMRERPGFRTLEYILREDEGEDRKCSVLQKARDLPEMTREEMYKAFGNRSIEDRQPTEAQITAILRSVGKYTEEDELNCGACGYPTCRDKAVAVFQGKAEVSMCCPMPWPRRSPCPTWSWM